MGRTLAAHLSLITAKAERGAFEINWSLQSSAFNNATENFLSFRTVLTGADFEVELNFHEFIVLRATIPTCLVSEDFQCAGCLVLSRSAWRCLSRSLFSLVPVGKNGSREFENSPVSPIGWPIRLCYQIVFLRFLFSLHIPCVLAICTVIEPRR